MTNPLVRVKNVTKEFTLNDSFIDRLFGADQSLKAVDNISFDINQGEILGLVGESGSGKSTTAKVITQLHEPTEGSLMYQGEDLSALSDKELKAYRKKMAMIFQEPGSSLNRRKTAAQIIKQPMVIHGLYEGERDEKVRELLHRVGLSPRQANRHPHEFSGGQQQRIGIARALAVDPEFIVADEPVSALDVSTQAQILNLLKDLQDEFDLTILFIAHDLSVIKHICDRIAVMYLGEIVEIAETDELFGNFQHPYTEVLLKAIPEPRPGKERRRQSVTGEIPSPIDPPSGCPFHTRCPAATEECSETVPELKPIGDRAGHRASCIRLDEYEPGHEAFAVDPGREEFNYSVESFNKKTEAEDEITFQG